jgi:hypothetical protein
MYPEDCPPEIGKWWQSVTYVGYTTDAKKRARTHFNTYLTWAVQVNRVIYSPPVTAKKARKLEITWSRTFDGVDFWLRSTAYQKFWEKEVDLWPVDAESLRFWGARSVRARNELLDDRDLLLQKLETHKLSEFYVDWWAGRMLDYLGEA